MNKFILSLVIGGGIGVLFGALVIFGIQKENSFFQNMFSENSSGPISIPNPIKKKTPEDQSHYILHSEIVEQKEGKVAYADLGLMKISLYENGEFVKEYPIKSIGREGTAWQTPIGEFDINYKKPNHFSSIGHVYMPFSMQFFGNYFIHGWPYYPDGTPVPEGYSGGCIRMETDDAEGVYDFVDKNTKLVVINSENVIESPENFEYNKKTQSPQLTSNYLIADIETGEVVAGNNQKVQTQTGSFAKLMNAIISLESLNQYKERDFQNKIMTIGDVLYALLLTDNDEAGILLYEQKYTTQYLLDMNTRAESIQMSQTVYEDVNGDDELTISTLEDQFRLIQYITYYKPFLAEVLKLKEYTKGDIVWEALQSYKDTDWYEGGFVDENNTQMITLVTVNFGLNETRNFAILVDKSLDATKDTGELYVWLSQNISLK